MGFFFQLSWSSLPDIQRVCLTVMYNTWNIKLRWNLIYRHVFIQPSYIHTMPFVNERLKTDNRAFCIHCTNPNKISLTSKDYLKSRFDIGLIEFCNKWKKLFMYTACVINSFTATNILTSKLTVFLVRLKKVGNFHHHENSLFP